MTETPLGAGRVVLFHVTANADWSNLPLSGLFVEMLRRSDHATIRLIVFRRGPLEGDLGRALEPFTALGVYGEGAPQYGMLTLDIEPTAPLAEIVSTLRRGSEDGSWEYEEARMTQAWIEATAI